WKFVNVPHRWYKPGTVNGETANRLLSPPSFGHPINMGKDLGVHIIELHPSAFHHHLGGLKGLFRKVGCKTTGSSPTKTRDKSPGEAGHVNITVYADYGTRIEHSVDSRFAMVSHHKATELKSGLFKGFRCVVPQPYFGIIIL